MVEFELSNRGKSTARILSIEYHLGNEPAFSKRTYRRHSLNLQILAGASIECPRFKMRRRPSYPCHFTGFVKYTTIYNAQFETYFAYVLEGPLDVNLLDDLESRELKPTYPYRMPTDT